MAPLTIAPGQSQFDAIIGQHEKMLITPNQEVGIIEESYNQGTL